MAYNVKLFSHDAKAKKFVAECSDVFQRGEFVLPLTLVSDLGNEATFILVEVERTNDEDNEVLAWHFLPSADSVARNPRLAGYSLTLLND